MNFVKIALLIAATFLSIARADIEDFKISSAQLSAEDTADKESMLTKLKHAAIVQFLSKQGISHDRVESVVTAEFADQYIVDYKVSRKGGGTELSGHLDADGLRRWARLAETKTRGGDIVRPLLVVSSEISGLGLQPKDTAARVKDSIVAREIFAHLNGGLGKQLNTRVTPLDNPSFTMTQPPKTPAEIAALQEAGRNGGYNGAVWAHLSPGRSSGTRLDLYYFNFGQRRATLVKPEDLSLEAKDLSSAPRVAKALNGPLKEFESELTEKVSRGTLQSGSHRLIIEGIDSFRGFKQLDNGLSRLDFVTQAILKRSETNTAEFEVLSALATEDLSQRLVLATFPGFQLKSVRIEPQTIVMRFVK